MLVKILEIIGGLIMIFGLPTLFLWRIAVYQEKKGYHKDFDKRYAYYMKNKLRNQKA